jgi:exodeoxyribonuclease VII large subunit
VRDIISVLTSRYPAARIVIRPSRVQGDGAAADLARGLAAVAQVPDIDVVIIGRGGGSAEDLWAFNDERLARAIAACPVPVISGVGHEVDFTIADFVADLRAATPSNAAELVVDRAENFLARIERFEQRLHHAVRRATESRAHRAGQLDVTLRQWPTAVVLRQRDVEEQRLRLRHAATGLTARLLQQFDALRRRLERRDARRVTTEIRLRLVKADGRLRELATRRRVNAGARVSELAGRLNALSPLGVLGRGYAVCWNEARTGIIRSARTVRTGERVRVTLAEGELGCRVDDVSPDAPGSTRDT